MSQFFHEIANLFPLMVGKEFDEFVEDIRAKGVLKPIVWYEGKILDGRNRYRAAEIADVPFEQEDYTGSDPLGFVLSHNLHRNHYSESQRAMLAADVYSFKMGRPVKSANLQTYSQGEAAAALNVSTRSVGSASKVKEDGVPELVEAVRAGEIAVSKAADIAALPAEQQREILAAADPKVFNALVKERRREAQDEKKEKRQERMQAIGAQQLALPNKRFGVILGDPEWEFEVWSEDTGLDRSASNHYPTSKTEAIAARDVGSIAADDCVLLLWATAPMIEAALYVMKRWGFRYVSQMVWNKERTGDARGSGYWVLGEHELLLIGVRGKPPCPAPGTQFRSNFSAPVGEHSAKPDRAHVFAETFFPDWPKIEMNARGMPRPGWDVWGWEAVGEPINV